MLMEGRYVFQGFVIPENMVADIVSYVRFSREPGNFLMSVLCNDLVKACMYADQHNVANLPAYAAYLYNEVPAMAWGSQELVTKWLAREVPYGEDLKGGTL